MKSYGSVNRGRLRYFLLFFLIIFLQVVFLHGLFRPGFLAPDALLIALLARAYLIGRDAVLWAILGGSTLDILTDTIGLNLALYTLSVYLFILFSERFFFRSVLVFVLPSSVILLLKKLLALLMMKSKFSFEASFKTFAVAWLVEVLLVVVVYFIYLRRRE